MAENKKVEGRTAFLEKNMQDGMLKKALVGISKVGDAVGFTQEEAYKGKTKEELAKKPGAEPEKKAAGGMISSASKRADGCAQRGKTKGRMV
jgi:hypothetical protein